MESERGTIHLQVSSVGSKRTGEPGEGDLGIWSLDSHPHPYSLSSSSISLNVPLAFACLFYFTKFPWAGSSCLSLDIRKVHDFNSSWLLLPLVKDFIRSVLSKTISYSVHCSPQRLGTVAATRELPICSLETKKYELGRLERERGR